MHERLVACKYTEAHVACLARTIGIALVGLVVALVLVGCGESKPTRVLLVGGAGLSQLGDLGEMISARCPNVRVVETGGWDGFRADLKAMAREKPEQGVILIGHSFGCQAIAEAAGALAPVDLVVMMDPV